MFELPEDVKMLRDLAMDFTKREIMPRAEHYDRTEEWPWEIFHKAREVGLVNLNIPEEYGGMGATALEECVIAESMAYGCSGIQTALMLNQMATLPLLIAGSDQQKRRYLPWIVDEGDCRLLHDRAGRGVGCGRNQVHGDTAERHLSFERPEDVDY